MLTYTRVVCLCVLSSYVSYVSNNVHTANDNQSTTLSNGCVDTCPGFCILSLTYSITHEWTILKSLHLESLRSHTLKETDLSLIQVTVRQEIKVRFVLNEHALNLIIDTGVYYSLFSRETR